MRSKTHLFLRYINLSLSNCSHSLIAGLTLFSSFKKGAIRGDRQLPPISMNRETVYL
jgi:hypothetical protein